MHHSEQTCIAPFVAQQIRDAYRKLV